MNKKSLIVSSTSLKFYTTQKLLESAEKLKYSVKWMNPYQSVLPLDQDYAKEGIFFHRSTGSNYDDFDLLVSTAHQNQAMTVTNPVSALKNFRSKDQQFLFFMAHNLPSISTLLYRGEVTQELHDILRTFGGKNERFILKLSRGNQGIGVNYIESFKSLLSLLETFLAIKDQRFIIQPFVEHQKEWRLLVCGEKVLASIEKKIDPDEFRGNAKRARARVLKKIPTHLAELALKAVELGGLHYAGVDLLEDQNGELKILEVNPVPGFEQVEKLTGQNVARELILYARNLL